MGISDLKSSTLKLCDKMMSRGCSVLVFLVSVSMSLVSGMNGNCNIDDRVRIALRTMNSNAVPKVVDCVIGIGACDSTGSWVRSHAREAVCGRPCGNNCSCREVNIRLIVRRMQTQFSSQWRRVQDSYRARC